MIKKFLCINYYKKRCRFLIKGERNHKCCKETCNLVKQIKEGKITNDLQIINKK